MKHRTLEPDEIRRLENRGCIAEDWNRIYVSAGFDAERCRNVTFYGDIYLGDMRGSIEVAPGFKKDCGLRNATLRNVVVGDNTLVENVGNFINNVDVADNCYISNVSTINTTPCATFGEGKVISVLNEMGEGNLILSRHLNSQMAAFMVRYMGDGVMATKLKDIAHRSMGGSDAKKSRVGRGAKVINTREIEDAVIGEGCEINGASRISRCIIGFDAEHPVYIGTGVICEDSIILSDCKVTNSVKMQNCFVGECCEITNGFTAESSVFFANSYMANGEACAAFCGPFTTSHHKSSLLIGGMFSFYNAGSSTNFSNHAYKMGPMHYGILQRGSKTASGAYILMPANIGAYSVCFGKLMHHPDTHHLPFTYLISYNDNMYLVPGRNITTAGLYRDIAKWPRRDRRKGDARVSIINFDWLSPYTVGEISRGKTILEHLLESSGHNSLTFNYHNYIINASSLKKGIKYYGIALQIYMAAVLESAIARQGLKRPSTSVGLGEWIDLSGLLMPLSEEKRLAADIINGTITTFEEVNRRFRFIMSRYEEYRWAWTYRFICDYHGISEITREDAEKIIAEGKEARRVWLGEIRKDAEKEYAMGDVERNVLDNFLKQLDADM